MDPSHKDANITGSPRHQQRKQKAFQLKSGINVNPTQISSGGVMPLSSGVQAKIK
jgi:hypothetical protein